MYTVFISTKNAQNIFFFILTIYYNYSFKSDAKNRVRWRILVDALCSAAEWWGFWM